MPDEIKPLTPEEVDALDCREFVGLEMMIKGCVSGSPAEWPMLKHEAAQLLATKNSLIATVRDRERERDEAKEWRVKAGHLEIERDELKYRLQAWDDLHAERMMKQDRGRAELQRQLAEIEADMEWLSQAIAEDKINMRHFGRPDESIRDAIRAARIAQGQAHE